MDDDDGENYFYIKYSYFLSMWNIDIEDYIIYGNENIKLNDDDIYFIVFNKCIETLENLILNSNVYNTLFKKCLLYVKNHINKYDNVNMSMELKQFLN